MFGRRTKPTHAAPVLDSVDSGSVDSGNVDPRNSAVDTLVAEPVLSDVLPTDTSPIRAERSGNDSGLAGIESEFTISDADMALLDLSSIAFDQLTSPLSATEQKMADDKAELDAYIGHLNESCAARAGQSIDLQPYLMVPERCWDGEHHQVLVDLLGLTPSQAWNVLPLPGDAPTAMAMGMTPHPGPRGLDTRQLASELIGDAVEKMRAALEQATFGSDTVNTAAFDEAQAEATRDIMAIARRMAGPIVGAQAVDHARATFFSD